MTLCLVTDRRRLCGRDAPSFEVARRHVVEQVRGAIEAEIDLVQVRERDLDSRDLATLVTGIVRLTRGTATRVVVNDRLDVALVCAADGVHLRSDSISTADARRIAPKGFVIGRSVHDVGDAVGAGGVDYLIAGTVFTTASKTAEPPLLGLDGLRSIVSAVGVPVLAIGGVTLERLQQIAGTGAAGVAAIGLFIDRAPLGPLVEAARRQFDSVRSAS